SLRVLRFFSSRLSYQGIDRNSLSFWYRSCLSVRGGGKGRLKKYNYTEGRPYLSHSVGPLVFRSSLHYRTGIYRSIFHKTPLQTIRRGGIGPQRTSVLLHTCFADRTFPLGVVPSSWNPGRFQRERQTQSVCL